MNKLKLTDNQIINLIVSSLSTRGCALQRLWNDFGDETSSDLMSVSDNLGLSNDAGYGIMDGWDSIALGEYNLYEIAKDSESTEYRRGFIIGATSANRLHDMGYAELEKTE